MDISKKIQKLIEAAGELRPGIAHIEVKHDGGCPALKTQNMADCICEPDFKVMKTDA